MGAGGGGDTIELTDADIIQERASLILAASNARSILKLTGTHGVVAAPLEKAALKLPPARAFAPPPASSVHEGTGLRACLVARAEALASGNDVVGLARAHLELASTILEEGDVAGARAAAASAAEVVPATAAVSSFMRRLLIGRGDLAAQLELASALAAAGTKDVVRADFLAERARLLEVKAGVSAESVNAWREALRVAGDHPGALYGLEVALEAQGAYRELAAHLAHLADTGGDTEAAAWLLVERAIVLDRRLGDEGGARAALTRALELAQGPGPVRAANVDYAVLHRDDAHLATLLASEASLEKEPARAARLSLDAALALLRSGGEASDAIELLERAHGHSPTTPLVDARIAHELANLYEQRGADADALRVRKACLRWIEEPREERLLLRAIATSAERAGALDDAVLALERARVLDADDATLLRDLDRLLVSAGRHEARAIAWLREAAVADEPSRRARAFLVAADAARAAGRDDDAARHLQSAWLAAPFAPAVYDSLVDRLAPAGGKTEVHARVQLYEQALRMTDDVDRRVYFLERIAWLWDDVGGEVARAAESYEAVLAIEPARMSAIVGLASTATRADDKPRLARALVAESEITADRNRRAELLLRASEVLSGVDAERALALARDLVDDEHVGLRAMELTTRIHAAAGRWDLAARSIADRRKVTEDAAARVALVLAEVDILLGHLAAPERALTALAEVRAEASGDPVLAQATVSALEALGDVERTLVELQSLARSASTPRARAALLLRAAEIEESREGGDVRAVHLYRQGREVLPDEALFVERLLRLGARVPDAVDGKQTPPLVYAARILDTDRAVDIEDAERLLAHSPPSFAALRMAERLARLSGSAPLLANALSMQAEGRSGIMALRALSGVASLVAWVLPETEDVDPWDRMLALGTRDVVVLETVVQRTLSGVRSGDARSIELAMEAWRRRFEASGDDSERLLARLELARLARRLERWKDVGEQARGALEIDAKSVTAAFLLGTAAAELGDRKEAIAAASALAPLVIDGPARAELLRDAADLAFAERDPTMAAKLLERALEANPDNVLVAARLAIVQQSRGAWGELARTLRRALPLAKTVDAILPMASELAEVAKNRVSDPLLAIEALERAREVAPDHVATLFNLAELMIGQRAWSPALEALGQVLACATEKQEKVVAHTGRARILARVRSKIPEAEKELRAALMLDSHDARAIRALLDLGVEIDSEERSRLLSALALVQTGPKDRIESLFELAQVKKSIGDSAGLESALVEAVSLSPDPAMLERAREALGDDMEAFARVVARAVARARESGKAANVAWLARLGQIEADVLGKHEDAARHLEEALEAEPARHELRSVLAKVFLSIGRNAEAVSVLMPLFEHRVTAVHLDVAALRLLEVALTGAGRPFEGLVARELRTFAGGAEAREALALEGQRRPVPPTDALAPPFLRAAIVPAKLRHPLFEVGPVAVELGAKLARIGLSDVGVSTRDRVKPKTAHPLRTIFDMVLRVFSVPNVELAVSDAISRPRLAIEDLPWVVLPASLADVGERVASAAVARLVARVALGVPWLDAYSPEEVLALIVAVGRQVAPSFYARGSERVEALVGDYELRARRAIDRKKKKTLEAMAPSLEAPPLSITEFAEAVLFTEARAAFLMTGDLRAALLAVAAVDPPVGEALRVPGRDAMPALMARAISRDLVLFALDPETSAIRQRIGAV